MVEEATSIILDGLVEVLKECRVQCCSVVLPGGASITGGKEFARLTSSVSGVAAVLRVSLLLWLRGGGEVDMMVAEADGGRVGTTLAGLMNEISGEGAVLCVLLLVCVVFAISGRVVCLYVSLCVRWSWNGDPPGVSIRW